jgi:hypothetical protein
MAVAMVAAAGELFKGIFAVSGTPVLAACTAAMEASTFISETVVTVAVAETTT